MSAGTPTLKKHDDEFERSGDGPLMTLAEFHALPEDPDIDRMLIRGRLWEKPLTKRNRKHSRLESRIAQILGNWADSMPEPRPEVYSGEVGCNFPDLGTGVGIDVAVVSGEMEASLTDEDKFLVGAPALVVEILSPSDRVEEINLKIDDYLAAGVPLVWIVDPFRKTIVQHRPDADPEMFTGKEELSGGPYLPGFTVTVSRLFGR